MKNSDVINNLMYVCTDTISEYNFNVLGVFYLLAVCVHECMIMC